MVEAVHWAASNGDRSENGDYHLRQEAAARNRPAHPLPDAAAGDCRDRPTPRCTIGQRPDLLRRHRDLSSTRRATSARVTILGIDEADSAQAQVSWISPIARALLKARVGDVVKLATPAECKESKSCRCSYPAPAPLGFNPSADAEPHEPRRSGRAQQPDGPSRCNTDAVRLRPADRFEMRAVAHGNRRSACRSSPGRLPVPFRRG